MTHTPPSDGDRGGAGSMLVTGLLIVVGIALLLPGLCTAVVALQMLADGELKASDPYMPIMLVFWGICALIALGGVLVLRAARRRLRRSADQ